MTPQLERKTFVANLIGLVVAALERQLNDEAQVLLAGVRVLRPRLVELDLFEAQIAMNRDQYPEAIQWLRNVENSPTQWSWAKALMAMCQYRLDDSDWRINVNDILLRDDALPHATAMARRLQAGPRAAPAEDEAAVREPAAPPAPAPGYGFDYAFMHMRA